MALGAVYVLPSAHVRIVPCGKTVTSDFYVVLKGTAASATKHQTENMPLTAQRSTFG